MVLLYGVIESHFTGHAGATGFGSPETLQQVNFVKEYLGRR